MQNYLRIPIGMWKYGPVWLGNPTKWPVWNHSELLHLQVDDEQECGCSMGTQPSESGLHCIINIVDYNSLESYLVLWLMY